ncbi:hypothetical protein DV711_06155 [Motiliproteus coralliicola]|uniref:Uncharacterized protein n=1 Tax=Motiliproteus coralliicola TaxID=2283196 RepID=A0A369X034_9GAMM|nr:hypothetical protein [Motiliproteus coralliicola]RDE25135.1 hypothetical protein DV711_06155 [Motiliproteus coralliicola]
MAAAGAWVIHHKFLHRLGLKEINLSSDSLKCALFTSASNAATLSVTDYASLTNQVANANGYTTGGLTLAGVVWGESAGTVKITADDPIWTAAGGDITARYAVIYDDTHPNKAIIAHCLLDSTPADLTATDGNTLKVDIDDTNGVFTGA